MRCLFRAMRPGFLATAVLALLAAGGRGQEAAPPAGGATQGPRYWIADLEARWDTADVPTRVAILDRVGRKKVWHDKAVPLLRKALRDRDAKVRANAAVALLRSTRARSAVAELSVALTDPDREVRNSALWALNSVGPAAQPAISTLAAMLRADRDRLAQVFSALASIGQAAVPTLLDFVADADPAGRQGAADAIARIGPEARSALPALLKHLDDSSREVRWAVAMALAAIGPAAIDPLTQALRNPDPRVRGTAARALGHMRDRAGPAVPALIDALFQAQPFDDPARPSPAPANDERREEPPQGVYAVLEDMGKSAIPALVDRLRGRDREARVQAMRALGYSSSWENPGQAISLLIEDLADADIRLEAVEALGMIGTRRREEAPGLIDVMRKSAVPPLLQSLGDEDPVVRRHAARALGKIGAANDQVVPALVRALKDPDRSTRIGAIEALGAVGPTARPALDELARLRDGQDPEIRRSAEVAIRAIRPGAP